VLFNRDRLRTDDRVIGFVRFDYFYQGSWHPSSFTYPTHTFRTWERIFDVQSRDKKAVKPVYHYAVTASGPMETVQYSDGVILYRASPGTSWPIHQNFDALYSLVSPYSNTVLYQDTVNAAFAEFANQVPEVISIANFLFELRDVKSLIPRIESSLAKTARSGLLNYSFGWKPLVSDLKSLGRVVDTVMKRIQFLRDTSGRVVRLGFERDLSGLLSLPYWIDASTPYTSQYTRYNVEDYRATFRAGGNLFHRLQGLDDDLTVFRAFSQALGLNNPTKILWNALPYSFVIDWFARIGGLLDRLAIQPYEGVWRTTNVTSSLRDRYIIGTYQNYFPQHQSMTKVGEYRIDRYERSLGLPVNAATSLNSLNPTQQLLAGALLSQRLHR